MFARPSSLLRPREPGITKLQWEMLRVSDASPSATSVPTGEAGSYIRRGQADDIFSARIYVYNEGEGERQVRLHVMEERGLWRGWESKV